MIKTVVIGTGYVGLTTAVGLADFGNNVVGVDIDSAKINVLRSGKTPHYEPGMTKHLNNNLEAGRLSFTDDFTAALREADVVFLTVPTPSLPDGGMDLTHLEKAAHRAAESVKGRSVFVIKSTVLVGTCRRLQKELREKFPQSDIDVVSNPEFLREGSAINDFFHPDRMVIGCESQRARRLMERIYRNLFSIDLPFVWCNLETAELIKYASNAFLAAKIGFINQMANLADAVGADVLQVARAMGMDKRISAKFLHPGPGFGGSCFPKDLRALIRIGEQTGVNLNLIESVNQTNEAQKKQVFNILKDMITPLENGTVAVLGLAFKAETDDVRESPSLTLVEELLAAGFHVRAHDPQAIENFRVLFPKIVYASNPYEAVKDSDAVVLMTEWKEYRSLDFERIAGSMRNGSVLDARNILAPPVVRSAGLRYRGIGRGT